MSNNRQADLMKAYLGELCAGSRRIATPSFGEWMRRAVGTTAALGLSVSLGACGGSATSSDAEATGGDAGSATETGGSGGVTTGGSGGAGAVAGTGATGGTLYGVPMEDCDNGSDDDSDGQADCADDDCATLSACSLMRYAAPLEFYCDDGLDDDQDGAIDCADRDCLENGYCDSPVANGPPLVEGNCRDGVDEDADGLTDCADPDCVNNIYCLQALYAIPF